MCNTTVFFSNLQRANEDNDMFARVKKLQKKILEKVKACFFLSSYQISRRVCLKGIKKYR